MDADINVEENLVISTEIEDNKLSSLKWSKLLLFLLSFFGIAFVIGIIIGIVNIFIEKDLVELLTTSYPALILDAIAFFTLFFIFKSVRQFSLKAIDFSVLRSKKTYLYIALGFIIFLASQYFFIYILKIDDPLKQQNDLGVNQLSGTFEYILYAFLIVLIVPIKEELLFRGILYRFFETKYPRYGFWIGLVISASIFGFLHVGVVASAIVMGLVFVMLFRLTKSLIPSMLLHMIWNLYGITLIFLSL